MHCCSGKTFHLLHLVIIIFLILIAFPSFIFSGTTGKISGRVVDRETGEPLIGTNIILESTYLGAASDQNGNYVILNIPPGRYTVIARMMGYEVKKVENVKVSIDLTTQINFELSSQVLDSGGEVVVIAERPLIQRDLTNTIGTTSAEQIGELPVEEINDVIEMEAGIVRDATGAIHIRGGRSTEVAYLVDGVPVTDPFAGGSSIDVENQGIQELQVISGTFNAEYGQAQSGIINIVTKEGGSKYQGTISGYLGSHASRNENLFMNIDNLNPSNIQNLQGSFSGPVPFTNNKLTFLTSFRFVGNNGFLYGQRRVRVEDTDEVRLFQAQVDRGEILYERGESTGALNIPDSLTTGDGKYIPLNPLDSFSFQTRLAYQVLPNLKLSYTLFRDYSTGSLYNDAYRYAPDGVASLWKWGFNQTFSATHTLSSKSFYVLNISNFSKKTESYLYENPLDTRYFGQVFSSGGFNFGGTENEQSFVKNNSIIAKFDFTNQVDHINLIKAGFEVKRHDIQYLSFRPIIREDYDSNLGQFVVVKRYIPELDNPANNKYRFKPIEAALYLQDKLEVMEIVLNVGLRFDYLDPRADVPDNLRAIIEGGRLSSKFVPAKKKKQWSPRIGLSFPISDQGAIHLAYGHFFQVPPYSYLFDNATFKLSVDDRIGGIVGNADLEPERTVAYELGLQQQLAENTGLRVTVYYKNIRNLLGMELVSTANYRVYAHYINQDFGNTRGVIVALDQRQFGPFSATVDYTYQVARGNSSDPNQVLLDNQTTPPRESEKQVLPLDWDQTHTINATLTLSQPGNWGVSLLGRFGTGQPYTPTNPGSAISTQFRNSARKPNHTKVDVKAHKDFKISGYTVSAFVKVFNLFDTANHLIVYSSTGRADREYRTPAQAWAEQENRNFALEERDRRPHWYSEPRRVLIGFSVEF
jgi:outer membrane receptor protein involved in Fe transport